MQIPMKTRQTADTGYTLAFVDIKGDAGQVVEEWRWTLRQDFDPLCEYDGDYYGLMRTAGGKWQLVAKPGLVWDYATGWFDYDAMKEASLPHDILHWLMALGIISVKHNDKVDQEFYLALRWCRVPNWRAKWLRRGTNTVDQKVTGVDRAVTYLNRGKRVG